MEQLDTGRSGPAPDPQAAFFSPVSMDSRAGAASLDPARVTEVAHETAAVIVRTGRAAHEPELTRRQVLHRAASLSVELHHLPPGGTLELDARHGGEELFVCEGSAAAQGIDLQRWSWWRRPAHEGSGVLTSSTGATVWLKRGHLDRVAG